MENSTEKNNEYGVAYDSKRRFISYWHQIREILSHEPKRVLEVGVGNGFISRYLREHNVDLLTLDYCAELNPDVVADVSALPFLDGEFDIAAAYEILEHMPYEKSLQGLGELRRVSSCWVIISLPDASPFLRFEFPIPKVKKVQLLFTIPFHFWCKSPYAKSHEWEIGIQGYPLGRIKSDIQKTGLTLVRTYRVYENPYHRFFILRKP